MLSTLNVPKSNFQTYRDPRSSPCPKTSQPTLSNDACLPMKQADKFSAGKFRYFSRLPSQRASLFLRQCAVNWIISNCQPLRLKFLHLKKSWFNVPFLTLLCASPSTEGLHMFSANPTAHRTAFECFVKFSIVVKYMSLLFPRENPHTHSFWLLEQLSAS